MGRPGRSGGSARSCPAGGSRRSRCSRTPGSGWPLIGGHESVPLYSEGMLPEGGLTGDDRRDLARQLLLGSHVAGDGQPGARRSSGPSWRRRPAGPRAPRRSRPGARTRRALAAFSSTSSASSVALAGRASRHAAPAGPSAVSTRRPAQGLQRARVRLDAGLPGPGPARRGRGRSSRRASRSVNVPDERIVCTSGVRSVR